MNQKISGYKDVLIYLSKLEKEFPVQEWEALGFHIWPVLRISLGLKLYSENCFTGENQIAQWKENVYSESLSSVYHSALCSVKDFSNNQTLNDSYSAIFLNVSSTRYYKLGKKWFNPFSDSFINYLEKDNLKSLVLEYVDTKENKIPRYRSSKYITSGVNSENLKVILKKKSSLNLDKLHEFKNFLKEVNLPEEFFATKILRVFHYSQYFTNIFKRTNPKLALLVGYFSYLAMGYTLAAKKLKIKSIDIQHGIQSENDFLYSKWLKSPAQGYEVLPEYFWCWSEKEKNNINEWASELANHSALTGGNPVLQVDENNKNIKFFIDEIKKIKNSKEKSVNILYTHQASYQLTEFFIEVIKNSPKNWIWWFRFHPQYMGAKDKILLQLSNENIVNVIYEKINEYPLALLLNNIDIHVTDYSSSVLEAEMMGVPTIFLSNTGVELYGGQIESGIAKPGTTEKDFFESAQFFLSNKGKYSVKNNKEKFKEGINILKNLINQN